jgi:UDP-N-acetylmuramate dehydrogenase
MKTGDALATAISSMRCGGRIAQLLTAESGEEIIHLAASLDDFIILGGGTNIIFPDGILLTPVVRLGKFFEDISETDGIVYAGAAATVSALLAYCRKNGLAGIEFMAGIPGTIGGAVKMNAGTNEKGIMDAVSYIDIADRSGAMRISRKDINYAYRHTGIPERSVIIGVGLSLSVSSPDEVSAKVTSFMDRRGSQPKGHSCGCIFKNPPGQSAGYLIDRAGMKGLRIGGAVVSDIHANFIINDGSASTSDILILIGKIKEEVRKKYGIELEEEVRIIA